MTFSPDGRLLATAGGYDDVAIVWQAATGRQISRLEGHKEGESVRFVVFSRNSKLAATGNRDGTAAVFDAESGRLLYRVQFLAPRRHGGIRSIDFGPETTGLMAIGNDTGTFALADSSSGRVYVEASLHQGMRVMSVAFTSDGRRVGTAGEDGTAALYEVEPAALSSYLCSIVDPGIPPADWHKLLPSRSYPNSCRDFDRHGGATESVPSGRPNAPRSNQSR